MHLVEWAGSSKRISMIVDGIFCTVVSVAKHVAEVAMPSADSDKVTDKVMTVARGSSAYTTLIHCAMVGFQGMRGPQNFYNDGTSVGSVPSSTMMAEGEDVKLSRHYLPQDRTVRNHSQVQMVCRQTELWRLIAL